MNEEDVPRSPALGALISRARQAAPPRARLDGVRARLEAQLGPLGSSAVDPQPVPPPVAPPASSAGPWIALAVVAIVAVALGVLTMGGDDETVQPTASPALEVETPRETTTPEVTREVDTEVVVPEIEAAPVSDPAPEVVPSAHPTIEREHREPLADPETHPETDPESSLREEVALLERAMRHRREGDLDAMRATLAEHAARFPNGHLAPERTRLLGELAAERAGAHEDPPRTEITP